VYGRVVTYFGGEWSNSRSGRLNLRDEKLCAYLKEFVLDPQLVWTPLRKENSRLPPPKEIRFSGLPYCTLFTIVTELPHILSLAFYICSSVHRNSRLKKSNKMQQYADIYLLLNYSTYFGRPLRPSQGVHKPVVAASDTDHTL